MVSFYARSPVPYAKTLWKLFSTDLESQTSSSLIASPLLISHDVLLPGQWPIPGRSTRPLLRSCEQLGRTAQMAKSYVSVCSYFRRRSIKYGHVRTLHVEKPADESVDLWIREIKIHGEIFWKLIWIIIVLYYQQLRIFRPLAPLRPICAPTSPASLFHGPCRAPEGGFCFQNNFISPK